MLENDGFEKVYISFQMWRVGVVYVKFYMDLWGIFI